MTPQGLSPLIDTLSPQQVSAYLRRKGWDLVSFPNANLLVFKSMAKEIEALSIMIPAKQEFADYPAKLRDCVMLLSDIYNMDAQTIVHHIAHWDRDVHKIRLDSPLTNEQLLPLHYASQIIDNYRAFIGYAAATESKPRRFFAKMTDSGREFVKTCMFGHTFAGSFGLTIECPLGLSSELPMPGLPPPKPFHRAVTERIATAYADLTAAVQNQDPDIIVNNYTSGFSGNMCESLVNIFEISKGRTVSQRMIWAAELPPPPRLLTPKDEVRLDQKSYIILQAASKSLHTIDKPEEDKMIEGRVTRLSSEKPPLNTEEFAIASRTIVVLWEEERAQILHIHIELPIDQYRKACDAHKNGKRIKIIGKIRKEGRYWKLFEHHDFKVE